MGKDLENKSVSIIIPVYNQYESLMKVLKSLSNQSIPKWKYQTIIVDDGSNDQLSKETSHSMSNKYEIDIILYHQINKGRAAARNTGIRLSENDILIFCDADRVPCEDYIYYHLLSHDVHNCVVVGKQYDIFAKSMDTLFSEEIMWDKIKRFSREPNYYSRITKIYEHNNQVPNHLLWMSFLVGNSSISKKLIIETGCFDEEFIDWGFEHFELGLRLQKQGAIFKHSDKASNYHIPHSRSSSFYFNMIEQSAKILSRKHPEVDIEIMKKILFENVNVCEFASLIFKPIKD